MFESKGRWVSEFRTSLICIEREFQISQGYIVRLTLKKKKRGAGAGEGEEGREGGKPDVLPHVCNLSI